MPEIRIRIILYALYVVDPVENDRKKTLPACRGVAIRVKQQYIGVMARSTALQKRNPTRALRDYLDGKKLIQEIRTINNKLEDTEGTPLVKLEVDRYKIVLDSKFRLLDRVLPSLQAVKVDINLEGVKKAADEEIIQMMIESGWDGTLPDGTKLFHVEQPIDAEFTEVTDDDEQDPLFK